MNLHLLTFKYEKGTTWELISKHGIRVWDGAQVTAAILAWVIWSWAANSPPSQLIFHWCWLAGWLDYRGGVGGRRREKRTFRLKVETTSREKHQFISVVKVFLRCVKYPLMSALFYINTAVFRTGESFKAVSESFVLWILCFSTIKLFI